MRLRHRGGPVTFDPHQARYRRQRAVGVVAIRRGRQVAHSAGTFDSEAAARSDVARVKKKMAGAKFARVAVRA